MKSRKKSQEKNRRHEVVVKITQNIDEHCKDEKGKEIKAIKSRERQKQ